MLISATPPPTRPERIIVATAPGDFHIFSPLLLTFLLRRRGWDVIYLGANVPADELESTFEHIQPELIIVSAQLLHTAATLKEIAIAAQLHNVPLAFGGLVFNLMPELQRLIPGYYLGESFLDAVQWVSVSLNRRLPVSSGVEVSESYQGALQHYHQQRASIESHIWDAFTATGKPTGHLSSINNDIAQTIIAALKLGEVRLLPGDISWIEHLLMGYRLPKEFVADFIVAYYEAACIHLGESASIIVDWLAQILITAKIIQTE
jgi:hypothetical protein